MKHSRSYPRVSMVLFPRSLPRLSLLVILFYYCRYGTVNTQNSNNTFSQEVERIKKAWETVHAKVTEPAPKEKVQGFRIKYDAVDVFQDVTTERPEMVRSYLNSKQKWYTKWLYYFLVEQTWFFFLILGLASAMLDLTMDVTIRWIMLLRLQLSSFEGLGFINAISWILFSTLCCVGSAACVRYISPFAAGSGIPEMKSILSGLKLKHYLSFRALIAKSFGLVLAYASGLFIGREGPYVAISAILANNLAKFPLFKRIRQDKSLKFQVLSAACAAGVATTFGAPVGGVLFSIEVTSTYYLIQNLWKAFFCAVSATLFVNLLGNRGLSALFTTEFGTLPFGTMELVAFAGIGVLFGAFGALFNHFVTRIGQFRRSYKILAEDRYVQVIAISVLTSVMTFINFVPLRGGQQSVINELFQEHPIDEWGHPNLFLNLTIFLILKLILTAVSIGLPIPCGLFTPVFIIGAASGRLVGELLGAALPTWNVVPGGYAVVGAAAFSAGVTRALSTSVIVFELTGQLNHMLPVLIAVLLATGVGNLFGPNIYDKLLLGKGLPYMPPFNLEKAWKKTAADIMNTDLHVIAKETTYLEINKVLAKSTHSTYPLIDSPGNMLLVGAIHRKYLEQILEEREALFQKQLALPYTKSSENLINLEAEEKVREKKVAVEDREEFLNERVTLELKHPHFDPCPFQIVAKTSLSKLHFMFTMLGPSFAYVTTAGRIVGVITKKEFMKKCWEFSHSPR